MHWELLEPSSAEFMGTALLRFPSGHGKTAQALSVGYVLSASYRALMLLVYPGTKAEDCQLYHEKVGSFIS